MMDFTRPLYKCNICFIFFSASWFWWRLGTIDKILFHVGNKYINNNKTCVLRFNIYNTMISQWNHVYIYELPSRYVKPLFMFVHGSLLVITRTDNYNLSCSSITLIHWTCVVNLCRRLSKLFLVLWWKSEDYQRVYAIPFYCRIITHQANVNCCTYTWL